MSFTNKAEDTAEQVKGAAQDLAKQSSGVINALHNVGIRSEYARRQGAVGSLGDLHRSLGPDLLRPRHRAEAGRGQRLIHGTAGAGP